MQLTLTCSGVHGYGEAAPIDRYDESPESALAYIEEHADALGDDPFALEEIMERLPAREFAARAAFDAALHDLQGKLLGRPVYQLLGLRRAGPPTTWTIWLGDPDDMARRAEKVDPRFKRLKLKLGGRRRPRRRARARGARRDDAADAGRRERRLGARRGARQPAQLAPFDVQYCEQPLAADAMLGNDAAEARVADPDLRRRELPHARRRRGVRAVRARDQRQAREVRRHPRGGAHGARGPRARARLHARLHDRVGHRHRRRRAHREPVRPRRSRRQHPDRARPVSRTSSSSTACSCRPSCPASASRLDERDALPAPRRGLQRRPALRQDGARRAPLPARRRRRDPRLDAAAGELESGVPVVASVNDALLLQPDDRARRRRDAGRPLPARVDRAS